MNFPERIQSRQAQVTVVGLGYVGLPLALRAAAAGFRVNGLDVDEDRIKALAEGTSYMKDVSGDDLAEQLRSGRFRPTLDSEVLGKSDIIVICVPTPLKQELPDMSFIEAAGKEIGRVLQPGTLVILESTTYPGATEGFLKELLEESGQTAGKDFFLGFSPERINPADDEFAIEVIPKIIGGIDEQSTLLMQSFYSTFIDKVVRVSSPGTAEMAKLLENTYRHVNIALINEIAILCHEMGLDVWEVIDAASTKPFGFEPFYPGPGWGGHCIPVDPAYLSWRVRQLGDTARFVELAREINARMPSYVIQRINEALNESGKVLKGSTVLVLGVTYKKDADDVRESPAVEIIHRLIKAGVNTQFHDPFVDALAGLQRTELTKEALLSADITVVVTDHSTYDWSFVAEHAPLIFDTRNGLKGVAGPIVRI